MVLLFAAAAVLAAEDGHDHGSSASEGACAKAYEWGGIFDTPTASKVYTWTAYKTGTPAAFAEAHMKVVFLPVADAAEATLTAAKAEAIDGMGHTPCTDVEPGETIVPADHKCSMLHFEGNVASVSFTVSTAELTGGHLAIFTEHDPSEFEVAGGHYLTEAGDGTTKVDIEALFTVGAQMCPPASPPAPPAPPPDAPPKKSSDNPCFSETATACRLNDAALLPSTAFAQCFGAANANAATGAARVQMRALKAGDIVLSSPTETTRVIVNQHRLARLASGVVVLEHETGSLALTPDHVLWADGAFRATSEIRAGSVLEPASKVTKVAAATHAVVNPLTTSGTILAAGPAGGPVVASVFPEWIAHLLHGASLPYPLPLSGAAAASYLFPASVQAYYDALLEPLFSSTAQSLKEFKAAVPAPVALCTLLAFDVALVAGFVLWSLTLKGTVALLAVGLVVKARQAKA